jgi:glucoamylase
MVGTSLGTARVWFTIGRGIVNEVYYPRVDIPQLRDLGFIVADGAGFWIELKELDDCTVECAEPGVPAVRIIHRHPRFTFTQRIVPEPSRDVLLIEIELQGDPGLRPYVLLAPHLGGTGHDNRAAVAYQHGRRMLWAQQGPFGLALAAVNEQQRDAFDSCSAGYSGVSDGWHDFEHNGRMRWRYTRAGPGNVALTGALPPRATLALGLATSQTAAATLAISALMQPFQLVWDQQCRDWREWLAGCRLPQVGEPPSGLPRELVEQLHISAAVLRTHYDRTFRGAAVASLSVPWGEYAEERPGYHLVWPRDLVECAGAMLALGAEAEAREILRYLIATQRVDGSWFQNQWLGGKPFWTGVQLDEVAFPVLLAGTLADRDALDGIDVTDMVTRALGFIARTGPVSPQDRWEETSGVNAFTLTVCLAALVSGARWLSADGDAFALELADYWNARFDDWAAAYDTPLARINGVHGYYVRVAPPAALKDGNALARTMPIKNRRHDPEIAADEQIGVDFLQLVRYGLRVAEDPLVRATIKIVDATLRTDLEEGPVWRRYLGDGYGEHRDGSPYDGTGHGRPWPLLTGERGHYELLHGNDALPYLRAMAAFARPDGMLPEQVWDGDPIPAYDLSPGRATGSAAPLAWAHAEFVKLAYSILEKRPVDRPGPLWARYRGHKPEANVWYWSPQTPIRTLHSPAQLGFCLPARATISWWVDDGPVQHMETRDPGLGVHIAALPAVPTTAGTIHFRIEGIEQLANQDRTVILKH